MQFPDQNSGQLPIQGDQTGITPSAAAPSSAPKSALGRLGGKLGSIIGGKKEASSPDRKINAAVDRTPIIQKNAQSRFDAAMKSPNLDDVKYLQNPKLLDAEIKKLETLLNEYNNIDYQGSSDATKTHLNNFIDTNRKELEELTALKSIIGNESNIKKLATFKVQSNGVQEDKSKPGYNVSGVSDQAASKAEGRSPAAAPAPSKAEVAEIPKKEYVPLNPNGREASDRVLDVILRDINHKSAFPQDRSYIFNPRLIDESIKHLERLDRYLDALANVEADMPQEGDLFWIKETRDDINVLKQMKIMIETDPRVDQFIKKQNS